MRFFTFEKLEVYQVARKLVKDIYELQNRFPSEERYALGDQIRRSATSITSNIAEGSGRNSLKEKIHFVEIAFGSMTESFSQLQNAQDLGYIQEADVEALRPQFNHVAARSSSSSSSSFFKQRSAYSTLRPNHQQNTPFIQQPDRQGDNQQREDVSRRSDNSRHQ